MVHKPNNPVPLQLRTRGPVTESRRCLRAVREEHVREAGDAHPQVRCHAVLRPLLGEADPVFAADIHLVEAAYDGVEAGGADYAVKLVMVFCGADAVPCDLLDGRFVDINEVGLRRVKELVEAVLDGDALAADGVGFRHRRELLLYTRIVDASARLVPPEVVGFGVGVVREEHVVVCREPEVEVALLP